MKKIQAIFAATALVLASAAVFAGTFGLVETYWKYRSTESPCTNTLISAPACDFEDGVACQKIVTENNQQVTYFYARKIMTDANPPVFVSCDQLTKYVGPNPLP